MWLVCGRILQNLGITADTFEHNGAICYNIDVPNIGPARAIAYDIAALNKAIEMAKENKDQAPIFLCPSVPDRTFYGWDQEEDQGNRWDPHGQSRWA